jgi:hypothetical protein
MIEVSSRRNFLRGLGSILAAPAIVSVSSLMPLHGVPLHGTESTCLLQDIDGSNRDSSLRRSSQGRCGVQRG